MNSVLKDSVLKDSVGDDARLRQVGEYRRGYRTALLAAWKDQLATVLNR